MKALVLASLLAGNAQAADVHVMISGGFAEAYARLVVPFSMQTRHKVFTARGPSMGETPQAIPNRLRRGEGADVIIMVDGALDALIRDGKVLADSKTLLARANIGVAVRKGAPRPDISTPEAFKRALLAAKSVAYSDSASGVYLASVIFPRLGIAEEMRGKARMIPADPVAAVVARGDAEIGIQTLSAMVPVPGVDIVGILPEALQKATVFAAGIAAGAKEPEAGRALIRFLTSSPAAEVIEKTGMQPLGDPPLDPDVRAGGLLYLNSIGLPKEARVCALRIAGYLDEFNPAYEKWKLRHEALIRLGRETFEREAPKHGLSAEKMAGELTDDAARGLARATPAIQLEACKSRLSALEQTVEPKRPLR